MNSLNRKGWDYSMRGLAEGKTMRRNMEIAETETEKVKHQVPYGMEFLKPSPFWIAKNFNISTRKPYQWFLKRAFDFVASLTGLILISPMLLAIALCIKTESKGPILFKQKRVGLYGRDFYMYKFRSMRQDAEDLLHVIKDQNQTNNMMFKMADDPRITKVGKFLRKYSLDELPQLFNVLKGEMSLVGPRPPIHRELTEYESWHYLRFSTLPGLTGMWQVTGRSEILDFNKVVELDYQYVNDWNLLLDIRLLFMTVPVVVLGKGAY